jgi:hypothetical protein
MDFPRQHHYIPQFLLRGFASRSNRSDSYCWLFRPDLNAPKETNIKNVGQQRDFYGDPAISYIEYALREHEHRFALLVNRLREGKQEDCDVALIKVFIAHLIVRTKNLRSGLKAAADIFFDEAREVIPKKSRLKMRHELKKAARKELRESGLGQRIQQLPRAQQLIAKQFLSKWLREVDTRPYIAEAFQHLRENINLSDITENVHIKTLSQTVAPEPRIQGLSDLKWELVHYPPHTLVLGDSVVIGRFLGVDGLHGLFNVIGPIQLVIAPLSDRVGLIGKLTQDILLPDPEQLNFAAAETSREFFIAPQATDRETGYLRRLGLRADEISRRDISEALADGL